MTGVPAFGVVAHGRKRVRCSVIKKLGVGPSARVRESLGILFDERNRFQGVRHHHKIRGLSVLFCGPLDFHDLGSVGKMLAIAGSAFPVSIHHRGICRDHLQPVFGLTDSTYCQFSYPLNSENLSPFGTLKVYLSCAAKPILPKTASSAAMTITEDEVLVMAHSLAGTGMQSIRQFVVGT